MNRMMNEPETVNPISNVLRKKILDRDNNKCMKCASTNKLEVHHILLRSNGGSNNESNLITLCSACHKHAPDNPIEFIKYCAQHISYPLQKSKLLTKSFICMMISHPELAELITDMEKVSWLNNKLDELYDDLWSIYISGDINNIGTFMNKHLNHIIKKKEDNNVNRKTTV